MLLEHLRYRSKASFNFRFRQILKKIVDTKKEMGKTLRLSAFAMVEAKYAAGDFVPTVFDAVQTASVYSLVPVYHVQKQLEALPAISVIPDLPNFLYSLSSRLQPFYQMCGPDDIHVWQKSDRVIKQVCGKDQAIMAVIVHS